MSMTPNAPSPPQHIDAPASDDLDERIRAAERRLIERDEQVRARASLLLQQTQQAISPQRWKLPLIGVGMAVLALCWVVSHRRAPAWRAKTRAVARAAAVGC